MKAELIQRYDVEHEGEKGDEQKARMIERGLLAAYAVSLLGAVGATITGSIVPFLAYARELVQSDDQFTPTEFGITILLILAAGLVAWACRLAANLTLSKLAD